MDVGVLPGLVLSPEIKLYYLIPSHGSGRCYIPKIPVGILSYYTIVLVCEHLNQGKEESTHIQCLQDVESMHFLLCSKERE